MRRWGLLAVLAAAAAAVSAAAAPGALAGVDRSGADGLRARSGNHAVFVQTDNPAGNAIVAYDRADDGTLSPAGTYPTGGLGGALDGSVVDHLASQGGLAYDSQPGLLFAVNAGSDTVSVFAVDGTNLHLVQTVGSGGSFPVSIAVHGRLVYVLNARNGGSLQGYAVLLNHLVPIPGSKRALGLTPVTGPDEFTHTPGQVAFSPDGSQLIVTTKANGNAIDVFRVGFLGLLSPTPVVNVDDGNVPFAIEFDRHGDLLIAEAGANALASYGLGHDGTVTLIDRVPTGQAATCWVTGIGGRLFYTGNAGSATESGFQAAGNGQLTLLGATPTDAGTVDAAASPDGGFLYVQTGAAGIVDELRVGGNGSLTSLGSVTVPDAAGGEGIVAT